MFFRELEEKSHGAVGNGVEEIVELMDSEAEELWRPGVGWNPRIGLVYGQYHGFKTLKPRLSWQKFD